MAFFNKKQAKERRKGENLVGKIIYCFLLFAPLLSILFTSLYTTFNKNAYQSYSAQNVEVKSSTLQINENSTYYYNWFDNTSGQTNNTTPLIDIDYCSIDLDTGVEYIRFTNSNSIMEYNLNQAYIDTIQNINNCTFSVSQSITLASQPWFKTYLLLQEKAPLDNAFEYGTTKVENSNLYNWAKNTGTYTVMHQTTQGLGIENTFIPMLMSYWLLISVIYFIYDIALILIWALHRRIHDLGDSI